MAKGVNKKEIKPKTLLSGMAIEQMEEIFLYQYAHLIVGVLDHQYEQKMKARAEGTKAKE